MRGLTITTIAVLATAAVIAGFVRRSWLQRDVLTSSMERSAAGYTGDQSCRACHSDIFDRYKRTAMGRAWYLPEPANVVEDYSNNNTIYDARSNLHYEMIERDGQYFQREFRLDETDQVTHELVRQVNYIVGSGEHVRSYVSDTGGFLNQLPVSWYSDERKWGLSPGYESFNHRFSRPIGPGCIACHNDYPEHLGDSANRYRQPIPTGIGCERCHGPGSLHVQEQTGAAPISNHATIVNPARLSGNARHDVCFQCHLQGDAEYVNPGREQYGYRPGDQLADYRSVYLAVSAGSSEDFGIASHATRMVQSRCFTESRGEFSCITCHDPHVPLREVAVESYRDACMKCHTPASCNRVPDGSGADGRNDCVGCHMPRGRPNDVQHTVFTDHWLRRPNRLVEHSPEAGASTPSANQAIPLQPFFDNLAPDEERMGLAHLSYSFAKGGRANLELGIQLLQKVAARGELHAEGWRKLGMAAIAIGDASLARRAFSSAVQLDPQDAKARLGLAMAIGAGGNPIRALDEFQAAIRLDPNQLEAYPAISTLHFRSGRTDMALEMLGKSLEIHPNQADVLATIGSILCQDPSKLEQGTRALEQAVRLEPDNVPMVVSLAMGRMAQGQWAAAYRHLQHARQLAPRQTQVLITLARLHMQRNERAAAIECLEEALQYDPRNQVAEQLLRELQRSAAPY